MANLIEYLRQTGRTQLGLAKQAGIAPSTLSAIRSGQRRPSPRLAKAIEAATGGEVKAAEMLGLTGESSRPPLQLDESRWLVWTDRAGAGFVPPEILKDLEVKPERAVVFRRKGRVWEVSSAERDMREVRDMTAKFARPGSSVVDELIAERRAEAVQETSEEEAWLASRR